MFGFDSAPLNSNYGTVLSTPGQGNNFGFGNQAAQGTNPWVSTYDQWFNNANTGAVMPVAGQQASVASQQVDQTPFDQTVQNYMQEFPSGLQQGAVQQGAVQQAATVEAQPAVAQQVAAQPELTDAVWTGENAAGDVIAATQYDQDPYANLPAHVVESIRANPTVGREIMRKYQQSLLPYNYRDRQMAITDPYVERFGFGYRPS